MIRDKLCPYCETSMRISSMKCDACNTEITGTFYSHLINKLTAEDLDFLIDFITSGFNIKSLAEKKGIGYAAIRTKLDKIIERTQSMKNKDYEQRLVLERLRSGEIDSKSAQKLLENINE